MGGCGRRRVDGEWGGGGDGHAAHAPAAHRGHQRGPGAAGHQAHRGGLELRAPYSGALPHHRRPRAITSPSSMLMQCACRSALPFCTAPHVDCCRPRACSRTAPPRHHISTLDADAGCMLTAAVFRTAQHLDCSRQAPKPLKIPNRNRPLAHSRPPPSCPHTRKCPAQRRSAIQHIQQLVCQASSHNAHAPALLCC